MRKQFILTGRHPLVGGHTITNRSQSATVAQFVQITYTQIIKRLYMAQKLTKPMHILSYNFTYDRYIQHHAHSFTLPGDLDVTVRWLAGSHINEETLEKD